MSTRKHGINVQYLYDTPMGNRLSTIQMCNIVTMKYNLMFRAVVSEMVDHDHNHKWSLAILIETFLLFFIPKTTHNEQLKKVICTPLVVSLQYNS